MGGSLNEIQTSKGNLADTRPIYSRKTIEKRALAGSVGSYQPNDGSLRHGQINVIQRHETAKAPS